MSQIVPAEELLPAAERLAESVGRTHVYRYPKLRFGGPLVAHICRLVAGAPLAIELAAASVRTLTCAEVAAGIEHNLDFLSSTLRDVPERHRSLRATFDHSWNLLNAVEPVGSHWVEPGADPAFRHRGAAWRVSFAVYFQ